MNNDIEEKILRLGSVIEKTGISRSTIYNMIKANSFPKPICIGIRSSGWLQSEINAWIKERVFQRNGNETSCYKEST